MLACRTAKHSMIQPHGTRLPQSFGLCAQERRDALQRAVGHRPARLLPMHHDPCLCQWLVQQIIPTPKPSLRTFKGSTEIDFIHSFTVQLSDNSYSAASQYCAFQSPNMWPGSKRPQFTCSPSSAGSH